MTQDKKEQPPISSPAGKVLDYVLNASRDKSREVANITRYQAALLPLLDTLHKATVSIIEVCDYRVEKRKAQRTTYIAKRDGAMDAYKDAVEIAQDNLDRTRDIVNEDLNTGIERLRIIRPRFWESGQGRNDKERRALWDDSFKRIEDAEFEFDKKINEASILFRKSIAAARNQVVEVKVKNIKTGKMVKAAIPAPADLTDELIYRILQYSKSIGGMTIRNATDLAVSEVESQAMKQEDDLLKNLDSNLGNRG